MPGVAGAFATMDVVVGDVNPSGRLPITMPMVVSGAVAGRQLNTLTNPPDNLTSQENQEGMTMEQYPGLDAGENSTYTEGWAFGYRWYVGGGRGGGV